VHFIISIYSKLLKEVYYLKLLERPILVMVNWAMTIDYQMKAKNNGVPDQEALNQWQTN
jgi:hypothetical protein